MYGISMALVLDHRSTVGVGDVAAVVSHKIGGPFNFQTAKKKKKTSHSVDLELGPISDLYPQVY